MGNIQQVPLSYIISSIESSNNQYALRFEPATYARLGELTSAEQAVISNIVTANRCTKETAKTIYSTSYGLYQSMGFNIYSGNYKLPVGVYMVNTNDQLIEFNAFCAKRGIKFTPEELAASPDKRHAFALAYNGASSYADLIAHRLNTNGYNVVMK